METKPNPNYKGEARSATAPKDTKTKTYEITAIKTVQITAQNEDEALDRAWIENGIRFEEVDKIEKL